MDIIVTTPKSRMKEAAQEAADCIAAGNDGEPVRIRFWAKGRQTGYELTLRTVYLMAARAKADSEDRERAAAAEKRGRAIITRRVKRFGYLY